MSHGHLESHLHCMFKMTSHPHHTLKALLCLFRSHGFPPRNLGAVSLCWELLWISMVLRKGALCFCIRQEVLQNALQKAPAKHQRNEVPIKSRWQCAFTDQKCRGHLMHWCGSVYTCPKLDHIISNSSGLRCKNNSQIDLKEASNLHKENGCRVDFWGLCCGEK